VIINQDENLVVPDKTIAFFPIVPNDGIEPFNLDNINLFLNPLNTDHKRNWFSSNFYRCLPLSIGNMQGFVFSIPYSFDVYWNGGDRPEDIIITYYEDFTPYKNLNFIYPNSEFGHGVLTLHYPVILKTPPGVNLMTISPPNYPLPGMSPMTGVVEADNIRFGFTLNLKIDIPNTTIKVLPNSPLVGIIPIPRYFCDSFELKSAYDIFDKEIVEEEKAVVKEHSDKRDKAVMYNLEQDGLYYKGMDVRGNKFKDHQLPKKTV
jgi:hypothetical protein